MVKEIQFGIYKIVCMKTLFSVFFIVISLFSFGQKKMGAAEDSATIKPRKAKMDSILQNSDRILAMNKVKEVYEGGAIVIRIILDKKSAELYRNAGNDKVADRIEEKLNKKNRALALAFLDEYFRFCPVYLIEAQDYGRVLNGDEQGYFLNRDLKVDTSIKMTEKNFIFLEFSNVYEVVKKDDSFYESEVTSTPIAYNALVFKDKNLQQIFSPYPYYIGSSALTIDTKSWVDWVKGAAFLTSLPTLDSVVIADTIIYVGSISPEDTLNNDSIMYKEYYKYLLRWKNNNKYISSNIEMLTNKTAFSEYIKRKYKLDKDQLALILGVWEYQLRIYGFYSFARDYKNKKWFKHLFSYPFDIPSYYNSSYFNFPNYNYMPDYQRIQNLNRYFNGFPNQ